MTALSLQEILFMIIAGAWRRRYAILVPVLLMPPLAFIASKFAPKQYEARMTILVQEPAKSNPFLNDWAVGPNIKDRMPALNAMLMSEHVLGSVLTDLGKINEKTSQEDKNKEVMQLASTIKATLVGNEIVTIVMKSRQQKDLAKTLSLVGARFTDRLLFPERNAVSNSEEFLQQQLEQKRKVLTLAEEKLSAFKSDNAERLPAVYTTNVQRLSSLREKLDEKQKELNAAKAMFSDLKTRIQTTNPAVGRIEENIVITTAELVQFKSRYTEHHSEVIAAERRLTRLKEERDQALATAKTLSSDDVDRLWNMAAGAIDTNEKGTMPLLVGQMQRFQEAQSKRVSLEADVKELSESINTVGQLIMQYAPIEQTQARLERAVTQARDLFELLSKRYELARITGALGQFEAPERVKIIDPPRDPSGPVNFPTIVFIIAGLVAGLAIGCGLAIAFEITDSRLRSNRNYNAYIPGGVISRLPRVRDVYEKPSDNTPAKPFNREAIYAVIGAITGKIIAAFVKYTPILRDKIRDTSLPHIKISPSIVPDNLMPNLQKHERLFTFIQNAKNEARKAAKTMNI
jgi:uncharacterized protein involved in exopolysaccharide biosynthesis